MYAVTVTFTIKPGRMESFMSLMLENAKASKALEPGCRQFDVCRDPSVPDQVFLYELYDDRAAFDAHMGMDHFKAFDAAAVEMIASKSVQCFEEVTQ